VLEQLPLPDKPARDPGEKCQQSLSMRSETNVDAVLAHLLRDQIDGEQLVADPARSYAMLILIAGVLVVGYETLPGFGA
jgi:hypothetical protein